MYEYNSRCWKTIFFALHKIFSAHFIQTPAHAYIYLKEEQLKRKLIKNSHINISIVTGKVFGTLLLVRTPLKFKWPPIKKFGCLASGYLRMSLVCLRLLLDPIPKRWQREKWPPIKYKKGWKDPVTKLKGHRFSNICLHVYFAEICLWLE